MNQLIVCQPGWQAVFKQANGDGVYAEPIACWLLINENHGNREPEVRPICAMGGDICDATVAPNYVGVVGPGMYPASLLEAEITVNEKRKDA